MRTKAILLIASAFLTGCTYPVKLSTPGAINFVSGYETKVPGRFIVVYDDTLKNVTTEVRNDAIACRAHTFPLVVGDSLVIGLRKVFNATLEDTREARTVPTPREMEIDQVRAAILVRLEDLYTRFSCLPDRDHVFNVCEYITNMTLSVAVKNIEGTGIFATEVSARPIIKEDRVVLGCHYQQEGCERSLNRAAKLALEELAERMANAPELRPK